MEDEIDTFLITIKKRKDAGLNEIWKIRKCDYILQRLYNAIYNQKQ